MEKKLTAGEFARSKVPPLNMRTLQTLARAGAVAGLERIAGADVATAEAWQAAWDNRNTKRGRPKSATDPGPTPQ